MLGREQIEAAMQRRVVLAAVIFTAIVPLPALAVLVIKAFGLSGAVAAGIALMAVSPGAPVALRRALDAGGDRAFAPALHLAIVALAVVTVPLLIAILDWMFPRGFAVTPLHIAEQVFVAQLLPLATGAGLRAWRPALASRIEAPVSRAGNLLIALTGLMVLADLPALVATTGFAPLLAGMGMTACALALGAACAGRDPAVWPAAAIASATRNPGLALMIATVNRMPESVAAAVIGYTLGFAFTIIAFIRWRRRSAAQIAASRPK
jgi:BASS family bile acid:Na+ symporter